MSNPMRLHPAAVLENLIKNLKAFIQSFIGISVIIVASPIRKEWILGVGALIVFLYIIFAILSWLRFSYEIYGDELRIEQGIFSRHKTYIPLERIQSISLSAGVVQRMFGLVKLEVQTAGGSSQAEASLAAITKDQAQNLEANLQVTRKNKPLNEESDSEPAEEKKLSTKQLLIAASTSNGLGVILLGLMAVLSQVNQFIPDDDIYTLIGQYLASYASEGILIWIIGFSSLLLIAWIASIIGTIISIGGFNLTRYSDRILVGRGLLEKRQINIPVRRIQAVKIAEGILRQPFGLVTIHIVSVGHGDKSATDTLIFPLLPKREAKNFLQTFLPEFEVETKFTPLSKAAKNRYRMILTIPALIITLPLIIIFKYGFLALLLPLGAYCLGIKQYNDAGWQITDNQLTIRFRNLGLVTTSLKRQRIQSFQLQQNPLQKRKGLKAFNIQIASNIGGTTLSLKGINSEDGDQIMNWLLMPLHLFP
ncbi:MAG TPA: PH domain-containing protein [Syntrophomonadaceae bacterium]|nr:PH domain-containing protein [Syntrophomonadaceae bacterium]